MSRLDNIGPLYHDFSFFGVKNEVTHVMYRINQQVKAPIIIAYIAYAIAKCEKDDISFTELFCADGFYALVASRLGCIKSIGIDNNHRRLHQAIEIAKRLEIPLTILMSEIEPDSIYGQTDIVLNAGGLYHVDDPVGVLRMSYEMAKQYLIVQSVVSTATDEKDYFEAPVPGMKKGNRFSRQSFDKMVKENCPGVVDQHFNILPGNVDDPNSSGSVYYLIKNARGGKSPGKHQT